MTSYILRTVFVWTYRGILCTCRFLWICPYNAIKFLPREQHVIEDKSRQVKRFADSESKVTVPPIPGSPDRMNALHKRLTKTEKEIMSLKTKIACERASWERRFAELQRQQEELCNQLVPEAGLLMKEGTCYDQGGSGVDNGDVLDECSSGFHQHRKSQASSRSDSYACSVSGSQISSSSALTSRPASSLSSASRYTYWRCSSICMYSHGKHTMAYIVFLFPTHPWTCSLVTG
ncbi:uncharacterized protein LOC121640996 [Melanotaenia boesemani]|uniref:uncharacterized protein LOC121640996 n=1 Tax=Melanotaenia boesemani TaxID=1250792 RepID=UPI001C04253C|nr:uncharacterized protein LOC121640996 [Melanotaenia boesemani]